LKLNLQLRNDEMKRMLKQLLKNRKGTAEIIGSVLFIVILLFFFTNVYLWHDSATKEMNDIYAEKMNSPIDVVLMTNPYALNITNKGGVEATLSMLWVVEKSPPNQSPNQPDLIHLNYTIANKIVPAGSSVNVTLTGNNPDVPYDPTSKYVTFKVVTTVGNSAACSYLSPG
jgi:hypothetical protein